LQPTSYINKKRKTVPTKIAIQLLRGNIAFRYIDDILYLKTIDSICNVHLENGEVLKSNQTLKHFADILEENHRFFILNRSLIINLNYIEEFNNSNQEIRLQDNKIISISRRGVSKFKEYINSMNYKIK